MWASGAARQANDRNDHKRSHAPALTAGYRWPTMGRQHEGVSSMEVDRNESITAGQPSMPIEQVQEGMMVVDQVGEKIGTVAYVQMGDPQAATTQGNEERDTGLVGDLARAVAGDEREPDVPEPKRSQLVRVGYVKIDGPGLSDIDRYVPSDLIGRVRGETVFLTALRSQLVHEH
jgi:hypothetical protein